MDIDLAVLADAATVDASGKLNILGIFDRISASKFPAQHPHVSLVLRFAASMNEAGTHSVEIRLGDPDGGEVVRLNGEMKVGPGPVVSGGRVRIPQVINMDRLIFPRPGRYAFDVSVDGAHQVSIPLFLHEVASGRSSAQA
jgi:hypothetical protein